MTIHISPIAARMRIAGAMACAALAGCGGSKPKGASRPPQGAASITLTSSAFAANGEIPARFTCDGAGVSPPLAWSGVPANAKSLALIVDDPDAPDPAAPKTTWTHWVVYDMPPSATGLREGAASGGLPAGARTGLNDWKKAEFGGACPPVGRHRYFHELYALDTTLTLSAPTRQELEDAMRGHVLARGELVGTYRRSK